MPRSKPIHPLSEPEAAFIRSLLIYEDASLLAFNKPSGLAVQGGRAVGRSLDLLLAAFAKSNGKRPRLVHRLDQGTSGVIIAARTQPAAAFLSEQFASRQVRKRYLAIVSGELPTGESGTICAPLMKVEEGGRTRMVPARPGRSGAETAVSHWRVLARSAGSALIELRPETGRMHQLRIHMACLGCPIIGDTLYGDDFSGAARPMLHAQALELTHPDGSPLCLSAPLPADFKAALAARGLQSSL